jgi:hypothetical protein
MKRVVKRRLKKIPYMMTRLPIVLRDKNSIEIFRLVNRTLDSISEKW